MIGKTQRILNNTYLNKQKTNKERKKIFPSKKIMKKI